MNKALAYYTCGLAFFSVRIRVSHGGSPHWLHLPAYLTRLLTLQITPLMQSEFTDLAPNQLNSINNALNFTLRDRAMKVINNRTGSIELA